MKSTISLTLCLPILYLTSARADFPKPVNTEKSAERFLSPDEALKSIELPPGFQVSLFAAEPDVQQPIAFCTDERGRLWVAENYTYAERQVGYSKDHRDRVVILDDTNGDGQFDKRTVFWDDADKLTSVEVGFGGVWVLCAPKLLFIPDRNRDDVPDGEPQVVLDGWNEDKVRHNIVNGLKWGPDGWLYGRHGILATSLVGKPGTPEAARTKINCGIWRYHPTQKTFEVVAHGTTNPWGFDFDDHGQMFFINTVIGHLWHLVPGAHYRRMYGEHFNPHIYQVIEQTADHFHWDTKEKWSDAKKELSRSTLRAGGGHAHTGMMIYLGDNWPQKYRGTLLTANLHGRRINVDRLERQHSGYAGKHDADLMSVGDPWFRGIELIYGADGGVFIADWSDVGECHENDGVHRTSGRIYKVTWGQPAAAAPDLTKRTSTDLARLQLHANDWYVRKARRLLQERAADGQELADAGQWLKSTFAESDDVTRRLRALWCLNSTGQVDEDWLLEQTADEDEHVRVWAVRLLCDRGQASDKFIERLEQLAAEDSSSLVRLFVASSLGRVPLNERWEIAAALVSRVEDANDPVLPLMVWYGIEPSVPGNKLMAVKLASRSRMPLIRQFVARRLASDAKPTE